MKSIKYNTRGISPVVATALLIVVAVISVVGFQIWFGDFSSGIFTETEIQSQSASENIQIDNVISNFLYFKNGGTENISITQVKVDGVDCNIAINATSGISEFNITSCLENVTTHTPEVVVYTNEGIYSEKVYLKNIPEKIYNNCNLSGTNTSHGESFLFYNISSLPYTNNCSLSSLSRVCNDGTYSGSINYNYTSCSYYDPYFANVSSLLHFDGNFTDQNSSLTWTPSPGASTSGVPKFGNNSLKLDGVDGVLVSLPNSGFQMGTGDFTIEMYFKIDGNSAVSGWGPSTLHAILMGFDLGAPDLFISLSGNSTYTGTGIGFYKFVGGEISHSYTGFISQQTWHHLAITKQSGTIRFFLDGIQVYSAADGNSWGNGAGPMRIGSWYGGYNGYFNGSIDEYRVTKGFALYTSNFTSPTSAFPNQ